MSVFLNFFPIVKESLFMKLKKNYKKTVFRARRLLRYLQLSDKNSRDISRYIYNFFAVFRIVMYLFQYFSRNPNCCCV
jgi:hypothetical protein